MTTDPFDHALGVTQNKLHERDELHEPQNPGIPGTWISWLRVPGIQIHRRYSEGAEGRSDPSDRRISPLGGLAALREHALSISSWPDATTCDHM